MTGVDHAACPPQAHDRSLPDDPRDATEVTRAADGLMGCADCGRPIFWCERDHSWWHEDPAAACFLAPAWELLATSGQGERPADLR